MRRFMSGLILGFFVMACFPPLQTVHAAAKRTTDGKKPRVTIILPHAYRQDDFPIGTKTFRVDTNLRTEDIETIWWSLDDVRSAMEGASAEFTFEVPSAHVVEACVMTGRANHCERRRLGPLGETIQTRLRPITVWVSRLDQPDVPVDGLTAHDFVLTHHGDHIEDRIVSVSENSAEDRVGICLAYLFDMSGSMIDSDVGETGLLVTRGDGTHALAPAVKARFDALAEVMKGTAEPGAARPDKDMIMGGVFAISMISMGPFPASQADRLPGMLENVLVREYLTARNTLYWRGTNIRENVALTATLLNHAGACKERKKAIAVDSDLMESFSWSTGSNVDERALEAFRKNYVEYDSDRLLEVMSATITVPTYTFYRPVALYASDSAIQDEFERDVVIPSGGVSYRLATGSTAETTMRLKELFGHLLRHIGSSYDLFWDPERIDDPEDVVVGTKDEDTRVTSHLPPTLRLDTSVPKQILLNRVLLRVRGWTLNYSNTRKLAAAMFVRKKVEEGKRSPFSRKIILKALETERGQPAAARLVLVEMELALCAVAEEDIKYGTDAGAILGAARDLEQIEMAPVERLAQIAASVPPDVRSKLCDSAPPKGRQGNLFRSTLCATK